MRLCAGLIRVSPSGVEPEMPGEMPHSLAQVSPGPALSTKVRFTLPVSARPGSEFRGSMPDIDATRDAAPTSPVPDPKYMHDPRWKHAQAIVERDILPKLLLTPHVDPTTASPEVHPRFDDFLNLVRRDGSDPGVWAMVQELIEAGTTVETIHAELFSPVARKLGVLWEEDECDFTEVAMVCSRLQRAIRHIASEYGVGPAVNSPRVLVSALPGSHHTLGPLMVAESLAGCRIDVSIGEPFISDADPRDFDVVAISVARAEEMAAAQAFVEDLREQSPEIRIIVGGAAFWADPSLVARLGADGWAQDASAAVTLVHDLTGTSPRD